MQTTSQHSLTKRIILHTKEGYTYGVVHFLNREHTTPELLSVSARNHRSCRIGNFWKGARVSKIIAGAKIDACVIQQKKERWIFSHVCNGKFAVFWKL